MRWYPPYVHHVVSNKRLSYCKDTTISTYHGLFPFLKANMLNVIFVLSSIAAENMILSYISMYYFRNVRPVFTFYHVHRKTYLNCELVHSLVLCSVPFLAKMGKHENKYSRMLCIKKYKMYDCCSEINFADVDVVIILYVLLTDIEQTYLAKCLKILFLYLLLGATTRKHRSWSGYVYKYSCFSLTSVFTHFCWIVSHNIHIYLSLAVQYTILTVAMTCSSTLPGHS